MLNLEKRIPLTKANCEDRNLADHFGKEDLAAIGVWAWEGYQRDKTSRWRWETRMQAAMNLALQLQEAKNFPWPDCSNIKFPLVTIAALQFHSRAYPMLIQGTDVVRYKVWDSDPQGEEAQRALRIGKYMSWQLLEEDEDWEEQHDRMLLQLPIIGCAFKKTYYNAGEAHNDSELVSAFDLVLDYGAKSVETAARKTHTFSMYRNEIYEKCMSGVFVDVLKEPWFQAPAQIHTDEETAKVNLRTGQEIPVADESTPFSILEQHCWIDLDGDGYAEPYIVTLEESSQQVLRIVSRIERFDVDVDRTPGGKVLRIRAMEYFTKYSFIPSPDGGVYDMGFGILLGPLNESANSLINQLVDAGTLNNLGGGFLGRGAKIRGGVYRVAPFQWTRVDSTGDDLRKNIMPLPTKEPSNVLFQLLGLLINYTERVSGSTDVMMGQNPGQNTPAYNMQVMAEQGMKVYSNIFKRIWRCSKGEFRKLYELNGIYMPDQVRYGEERGIANRADFTRGSAYVTPVADPNITSEALRMYQAQAIKQAAMITPGYSIPEVEMEFLRALKVESPERLYPGPDKVPPLPNPRVQVEQIKMQGQQAALQQKQLEFVATLQEEHRLNTAKIIQLEAQAHSFLAQADGVQTGHQIAAFEAAIGAAKAHSSHILGLIQAMQKEMQNGQQTGQPAAQPGGMGGLEAPSGNAAGPGMGGGATGGAA